MNNQHVVLVVLLFLVGLAAIIKGGDWFVDSASWIAEATGIPKLIVGATVVSVGTTLPELLVSLIAAAGGEYDMAAGNAIGSVTANVAIIMSLALIFIPSAINRREYAPKVALMFLPLLVIFASSFKGNRESALPLAASIVLICIFALNVAENVLGAKRSMKAPAEPLTAKEEREERVKRDGKTVAVKIGFFLLGAVMIFIGAQLLQTSATTIATRLGASKQLIALTIVAIGTSLPELVTTITAIVKKENSLSVGNIIGANIIDLSLILSLCGIISGGALPMSAQTVLLDIPVCLLVGCVACVPALIRGKFSRWQGIVNLVIYAAYLTIMIIGVGKIGIAA